MVNAQLVYAALWLVAAAAGHADAIASASSITGSMDAEEAAVEPCDQEELIEVSRLMTTNARKLECQKNLNITEMALPKDAKKVCARSECIAALRALDRTLPDCRYRDWAVRYSVRRLLKTCGKQPWNGTEEADSEMEDILANWSTLGSGSTGSVEETPVETPQVEWSAGGSSESEFAPTPSIAPTIAPAPVPAPSPSSAGVPTAVSVAMSIATVATVSALVC